ncbi:MAG: HEAT repeat domain-containing protein, partial [Bacteroidales bacterium]|nr:HEAT repeat domain-containing protein [Bacteroidales bacterium]
MKRFSFLFCVVAVALMVVACGTKKTTVAVVVDEGTYAAIPAAVDAYVEAVGNDVREGVLVVDKWHHPDSIKAQLEKLYYEQALEGAVLIGEIPIPMLRDAQHFATAFKMFQHRNWLDSSIPSDRFYDDFDLKFDYIKQDEKQPLAHYYSLRADSPQEICCDIYSARIKAPNKDGKAHELIEAYLMKAVEAHKNPERMDNILHFAGHGYNSDAMNARIDEASALREQFPFLANYGTKLNFINFTYDDFVRDRITTAMQDETMDLAILHHHGAEDTQYFNGAPAAGSADQWLELAKNAFRTRIRRAKNQSEAIQKIVRNSNVPASWFADVNKRETILADSLFAAQKDLTVTDLDGYVSGAKVVIFDACYN